MVTSGVTAPPWLETIYTRAIKQLSSSLPLNRPWLYSRWRQQL